MASANVAAVTPSPTSRTRMGTDAPRHGDVDGEALVDERMAVARVDLGQRIAHEPLRAPSLDTG